MHCTECRSSLTCRRAARSGYVVEKMNMKTGKWEPLTHSVGPDVNEFRVPKLKEGEDYKFRVRAENDQGQSEPLDSDKSTKVKNPFGTLFIYCKIVRIVQ